MFPLSMTVSLQNKFNILFDWCQKQGMSLNISKCYSMNFYRFRSPINYIYFINNSSLGSVSHINNFGIRFSFNLDIYQHIENIISKVLNILCFVKFLSKMSSIPLILKIHIYSQIYNAQFISQSIIYSTKHQSDQFWNV